MKQICAWCQKNIENFDSHSDNVVSHGICAKCQGELLSKIGFSMTSFLNRLNAPVLFIDENGIVKTANQQARKLLDKDLPEIEGYLGGNVFECANAYLPEGCGNTIHCQACTIRRTIMETHRTGKRQIKIPVFLNKGTPDNFNKVKYLISTEKINHMVLLKIHDMDEEIQG